MCVAGAGRIRMAGSSPWPDHQHLLHAKPGNAVRDHGHAGRAEQDEVAWPAEEHNAGQDAQDQHHAEHKPGHMQANEGEPVHG